MNVKRMQTPGAGEVVSIELTCSDFDGEPTYRYTNTCSIGCADGMKMFFTPQLQGSTIHANVCAGRFEFVSKLSREWWARKAATVLGWDESKIREQIDPVWAIKMAGARTRSTFGKVQRTNISGPTCVSCGKSVRKGFDLCNDCAEQGTDYTKDYGSLDDL